MNKDKLPVVKTLAEIRANIKTVGTHLKSSVKKTERESYKGLVKRGACFVVDKIDGKTVFAPSRFVGYVKNNRHIHLKGLKGDFSNFDGGITNNAIEKVTGLKWMTKEDSGYKKLEKEYKSFCRVELRLDKDKVSRRARKYIDIRRGA